MPVYGWIIIGTLAVIFVAALIVGGIAGYRKPIPPLTPPNLAALERHQAPDEKGFTEKSDTYNAGHFDGRGWCSDDADSYRGMIQSDNELHEKAREKMKVFLETHPPITFTPWQRARYIEGFCDGYIDERTYITKEKNAGNWKLL